jgi:SAM-dependent methyltransferase
MTPCAACGQATTPWLEMPIDAKTLEATPYGKVCRCVRCGHGFIDPLPSSSEVAGFYELDRYYTQGASHIPDLRPGVGDRLLAKFTWTFDRGVDIRESLQNLPLQPGSAVCEIGCGHANNLILLKSLGHRVLGVDPDPKAIAQAAANGIEVVAGTGEDLPERLGVGHFDLVVMSHSLEHCIDPALAVRNVHQILRPGGLFLCEVPNSGSTHFEWNNVCSEMFDAPRHLHFFNLASLRHLIEAAGLQVEDVGFTGFTRHHSPGWRQVEQRIRGRLAAVGGRCPPEHTFGRSVLLSLATFMAKAERKYDSVRVLAVRQAQAR